MKQENYSETNKSAGTVTVMGRTEEDLKSITSLGDAQLLHSMRQSSAMPVTHILDIQGKNIKDFSALLSAISTQLDTNPPKKTSHSWLKIIKSWFQKKQKNG